MNQRMLLLRALSQPKPRYIIPKYVPARPKTPASFKDDAAAVLATAFVFWVVYFLMRHMS